MWERNMGRHMTFKQNDQSTCERQIKLDTRDQMQAWERKRAVKCRRLTVVNVECASVWMNSFFPSRLKEEQTREGEWEKRQNVTIRQHYYTGHAQIVFKSVHFLFLFFFLNLCLIDLYWPSNRSKHWQPSGAGEASSIKHAKRNRKDFSLLFESCLRRQPGRDTTTTLKG